MTLELTMANIAMLAIFLLEPDARHRRIYSEVARLCFFHQREMPPNLERCVQNAIKENCGRGMRLFLHVDRGKWALTDDARALCIAAHEML